jgi:hypothetical protein
VHQQENNLNKMDMIAGIKKYLLYNIAAPDR